MIGEARSSVGCLTFLAILFSLQIDASATQYLFPPTLFPMLANASGARPLKRFKAGTFITWGIAGTVVAISANRSAQIVSSSFSVGVDMQYKSTLMGTYGNIEAFSAGFGVSAGPSGPDNHFTVSGNFGTPGYYKLIIVGYATFSDSDGNTYSGTSNPVYLYVLAASASISSNPIVTGDIKSDPDPTKKIATPVSVSVAPWEQTPNFGISAGGEAAIVSRSANSNAGIISLIISGSWVISGLFPNGDTMMTATGSDPRLPPVIAIVPTPSLCRSQIPLRFCRARIGL